MSEYKIRITQLTVGPEKESLCSEMQTQVSIVDEAAGEYVEVEQHGRTDLGKIAIDPKEWPMLRVAIDQLIAACREAK